MSITIYGASDDLIEIDGDIAEEFYLPGDVDDGVLLATSNGCIFRIQYDGVWRISYVVLVKGVDCQIEPCSGDTDDPVYSDVLTIKDPVSWVALVTEYANDSV